MTSYCQFERGGRNKKSVEAKLSLEAQTTSVCPGFFFCLRSLTNDYKYCILSAAPFWNPSCYLACFEKACSLKNQS